MISPLIKSFSKSLVKPIGELMEGSGGGIPFNPLQLPSLVALYDASVGVVGDPVSQWQDQSPNSNNLNQATVNRRPAFIASGIGSQPSIDFDGVNDEMFSTNSASLDFSSDFTFYVVLNATAFSQQPGLVSKNGDIGYTWDYNTQQRSEIRVNDGGGVEVDTANINVINDLDTILEVHYQLNGNINFTTNGAADGTPTNTQTGIFSNTASLFVGSRDNTNFLNGQIGQIIMCSTLLSTSDRNKTITFLGNKYGIAVTTIP